MDRSGFLEWGDIRYELALFAFFYLIDSEVPVFGGTMGGLCQASKLGEFVNYS